MIVAVKKKGVCRNNNEINSKTNFRGYAGPLLERVARVAGHPSISGNRWSHPSNLSLKAYYYSKMRYISLFVA